MSKLEIEKMKAQRSGGLEEEPEEVMEETKEQTG
jgi:hypothetical protein